MWIYSRWRKWWEKMTWQMCNYEMEADSYNESQTGQRERLQQSKMKPHGWLFQTPTVARMEGSEEVWMQSTWYFEWDNSIIVGVNWAWLSLLSIFVSLLIVFELRAIDGIDSQLPASFWTSKALTFRLVERQMLVAKDVDGKKFNLAFGPLIDKVWISDVCAGQTFRLKKGEH